MAKLTKTEKAFLKSIVDTNFVKPHFVRKSWLELGTYRVLFMTNEDGGCLTISHAIKPRLFSGLNVNEDYVISELLEEKE